MTANKRIEADLRKRASPAYSAAHAQRSSASRRTFASGLRPLTRPLMRNVMQHANYRPVMKKAADTAKRVHRAMKEGL